MPMSSEELDRIADDMYRDRRISGSVHCGECGYSLKSLPYQYRCPECGQEYNARPLSQQGIFSPHEGDFPYHDIFVTMVGAGAVVLFGWGGLTSHDPWRLGGAAVFAVLTLVWLHRAVNRFGRFLKTGAIIRRIRAEEEWDS